ncbi:hypothetical protein [Formosa algae]|uniref:Outer membrane protein beta-barrel domain-containing protein n=1 Tax=Formosa algae TaxID=225843 RepID=A0A9X1CBA9_9FLAO|nr:hypothetical protein [Formosa algae]MBP1839867.1 hypothetical protein [Formosa algae]MDQ0335466.1 hypothetical protein [Formosa algae]OEI81829.1 hypothetical protein AST99_02800 [Formosa algae]
MKKILIIFIALLAVQISSAQDSELKDSPIDFNVDVKTNHLWRGLVITDKPMVAVFSKVNLENTGSFTAGFWGGMAVSNESDGTSYKEINYYAQYANNGFSIGIWDLFNTRSVENPDIWNYDKETTTHLLDLRTSYTFNESFPLRLEADILLYGSGDSQLDDDGDFEQRYSTYIEVSYPIIRDSKVNLNGFVGAGFSLNGDTHLYGDGEQNFDLVNVGLTASKTLRFTDLSFPVSATTMWNPSLKIARVQLAVNLF